MIKILMDLTLSGLHLGNDSRGTKQGFMRLRGQWCKDWCA